MKAEVNQILVHSVSSGTRTLIKSLLQRTNYEAAKFFETTCIEAALRCVDIYSPNLVFLDSADEYALDFCELINLRHDTSSMSVIVVSDQHNQQNRDEFIIKGAQRFFQLTELSSLQFESVIHEVIHQKSQMMRQITESESHRKRANLAEARMLSDQMCPHFNSNMLAMLERFIFDDNLEIACELLAKCTALMRKTLDLSRLTLIPIREEIDYMTEYTQLIQSCFGNSFSIHFEVSPDIDLDRSFIPPLIIQPLVENAIKHGLVGQSTGELNISFVCNVRELIIRILDKSSGEYISQSKFKTSHGLDIIKERLELLNEIYRGQFTLKFVPRTNESDCAVVTLTIPKLIHNVYDQSEVYYRR